MLRMLYNMSTTTIVVSVANIMGIGCILPDE